MNTGLLKARSWKRLLIAGAIALGGVLLYGIIANLNKGRENQGLNGDDSGQPGRGASEELGLKINETVFGPDVRLTENFRQSDSAIIWARIEAEDAHGVTVDGLCKDDEVTIESISGHGWFAGTPGWQLAGSAIVQTATRVLESTDVAKAFGDAWKKINEGTGNRDGEEARGRSKKRDGWGRDEDGDFARNEGGIIVCLPRSKGPVYAYDEHHLKGDARLEGRLNKHVPDGTYIENKCFFPVRLGDKTEQSLNWKAGEPGVLHILAWDNNYEDNSGDYHVKFRIKRNNTCGRTVDTKKKELVEGSAQK